MVEKLTRDRAGMRQTVALFTTMRAPVPESVRPGCRPATRPDVATPRASGPQPAAAIGRAGSNSRKCGSPLTLQAALTLCHQFCGHRRSGIEPVQGMFIFSRGLCDCWGPWPSRGVAGDRRGRHPHLSTASRLPDRPESLRRHRVRAARPQRVETVGTRLSRRALYIRQRAFLFTSNMKRDSLL